MSPSLKEFTDGRPYEGAFEKPPAREKTIRHWEVIHFVTCLQGLVNRDAPQLFLRYQDFHDDFWLNLMIEQGWLADTEIIKLSSIKEALQIFNDYYEGIVVWDPDVPATSNIASTLAGVDDLLAVRGDFSDGSFAEQVIDDLKLPIKIDLRKAVDGQGFTGNITGSAKNDAYRWLLDKYIKPKKVNPDYLGYFIDAYWIECAHCGYPVNHTLTNQDFIISQKGLVFDLHVYNHEAPVDDPDQPIGCDEETLKLLLKANHKNLSDNKFMHVAGFVPWRYKYTNCDERGWNAGGNRGAVDVEWRCTELLSCYDAYLDADALDYGSMVNASFFQHYKLPDRIPQNSKPTKEDLIAQDLLEPNGDLKQVNYIAHYVGDYDAAAWLYWNMHKIWNDPQRGELPLSWAFNPTLAVRHPFCMHWMRETRTENDLFIAGDNGAGYLNPANLCEPRPDSEFPSSVDRWEAHNKRFFEQWDLDVVGFIIDGHTTTMQNEAWDAYSNFATGGYAFHRHEKEGGMHDCVPWLRYCGDLPMWEENHREATEQILKELKTGGPHFLIFRSVLQTPKFFSNVNKRLQEEAPYPWKLVDMRTLFLLKKISETGEA